jgi:hypothetical protein
MMVPASLSVLLAAVPLAARAKAIGTWAAFAGLGGAVAPVAGGLLIQIGWRWIFWINVPIGVAGAVLAQRILPESCDENSPARPDVLGASLLAIAVGLLALALVESSEWGWASGGFAAATAGSVICAAVILARSRVHPAPVIELGLLRIKSFTGAFAASVLFYAAFGSVLLGYIEFLTGVWHYSALQAGLALCPAPLLVLPCARIGAPGLARLLGGPGRVAVIGAGLSAVAQLLWVSRMQVHPSYLSDLLPVQLLAGPAVGLSAPSLLSAGSVELPSNRFGTGSGVLNMARQIGIAIGVAALVAVLGSGQQGEQIDAYRQGVWLGISFFAGAALLSAVLLSGSRRSSTLQASSPPPGLVSDST